MKWSSVKIESLKKDPEQYIREYKTNSVIDNYINDFPFQSDGTLLRSDGVKFEYTNEEFNIILNLKHHVSKLSNVDLYPDQIDFINKYRRNKFNMVKHSRQVGMTHMLLLIALHFAITKSDKSIYWISNIFESDYNRFIKLLLELPFYLSPGITIKVEEKSIRFENGSRIKFADGKLITVESTSSDLLIVDNAGSLDLHDLHKIITMSVSGISNKIDAQFFISSYPTRGSYFEKIYSEENGYWNSTSLDWDIVPGRDHKWALVEINKLGSFENFIDEYHVGSIESLRDLKINLLND